MHEPAEPLLFCGFNGIRNGLLVNLAPGRLRRLSAEARSNAADLSPSGLVRRLVCGWAQCHIRRRRPNDPAGILLGLELGRKTISGLPAALECVGDRKSTRL